MSALTKNTTLPAIADLSMASASAGVAASVSTTELVLLTDSELDSISGGKKNPPPPQVVHNTTHNHYYGGCGKKP